VFIISACFIISLLQSFDINLDHFRDRVHHSFRLPKILVLQILREDAGNDLPGKAKLVLEPTALDRLSASGQYLPKKIYLTLRAAIYLSAPQ
jgi:hypothetical protein